MFGIFHIHSRNLGNENEFLYILDSLIELNSDNLKDLYDNPLAECEYEYGTVVVVSSDGSVDIDVHGDIVEYYFNDAGNGVDSDIDANSAFSILALDNDNVDLGNNVFSDNFSSSSSSLSSCSVVADNISRVDVMEISILFILFYFYKLL
jgi:hypothetical protein